MASKPMLKTIVTADKVVIEFDRQSILAEVDAWNRFLDASNRKDPTIQSSTYRITDSTAFMKYFVRSLLKGRNGVADKLSKVLAIAIQDVLEHAAVTDGVVGVPWTEKKG